VFRVVGDDNARVLQLQSGAVDVIDSVPPNQVQAIKSHGDKVESVYGSAVGLLVLNTQKSKGPFADKNARCAVDWSIDRNAVARMANLLFATLNQLKPIRIPLTSHVLRGRV